MGAVEDVGAESAGASAAGEVVAPPVDAVVVEAVGALGAEASACVLPGTIPAVTNAALGDGTVFAKGKKAHIAS